MTMVTREDERPKGSKNNDASYIASFLSIGTPAASRHQPSNSRRRDLPLFLLVDTGCYFRGAHDGMTATTEDNINRGAPPPKRLQQGLEDKPASAGGGGGAAAAGGEGSGDDGAGNKGGQSNDGGGGHDRSSGSGSSGGNFARAAARGTVFTFGLRLVSFACTQATLRAVDDPKVLGRAAIELELLLSTALFAAREGFRLALTRNVVVPSSGGGGEGNSAGNVAWLTLPAAAAASALALLWHLRAAAGSASTADVREDEDDGRDDFRLAGILYCVACLVEGMAEPAVLASLRKMDVALKASAEGVATVGKTVATLVALRLLRDKSLFVTAFGVAQLSYAVIYASYLYCNSWRELQLPSRPLSLRSYDGATCYMVMVFTLQGFFKHLLTEGDRIVLTALSGAYDQGVYAMGSGFGGMAARMLLQPLEENARLLWSRQKDQHQNAGGGGGGASDKEVPSRELEMSYTALVKLVMYVGFAFSFLAVNYTSLLLNVLAGSKWGGNAEATAVLSAFCVYTAFLAFNGMTEAFVYAAASSGADVGELGLAHTAVGCVFAAAASVAVTRRGTVGLVAANCVAMMCRSLYSVVFAARYFARKRRVDEESGKGWSSVLSCLRSLLVRMFPHPAVTISFAVAFFVTRWSRSRMAHDVAAAGIPVGAAAWWKLAARHVGFGVSCAIGIATVAYWIEADFRRSLRRLWHAKQA